MDARRIDHNISGKQRIFVRANTTRGSAYYNNWFGNAATGEWFASSDGANRSTRLHVFASCDEPALRLQPVHPQYEQPRTARVRSHFLRFPASWNNSISPEIRRFPTSTSAATGTNQAASGGRTYAPFIAAFDRCRGSHALKFGGVPLLPEERDLGGAPATHN